MPPENKYIPKSLVLTYISVFATLNALADLVPLTPIIGVPGSFRLGWIISPLTGIFLGVKMGGISCLIGGLIGIFLGEPQTFGPFTPLMPAVSAFITGMLAYKHWRTPAITLSALITVWLLLPTGREASIILIFHVTGLAIILSLRGKIGDFVRSKTSKNAAWGLFLTAYCGNISRQLFGNILFAIILNPPPIFFTVPIPLTLIEQLAFATGTMIMGISLNRLMLRESFDQANSRSVVKSANCNS